MSSKQNAPSPADVAGLAERLMRVYKKVGWVSLKEAADALTSQAARIAELERALAETGKRYGGAMRSYAMNATEELCMIERRAEAAERQLDEARAMLVQTAPEMKK